MKWYPAGLLPQQQTRKTPTTWKEDFLFLLGKVPGSPLKVKILRDSWGDSRLSGRTDEPSITGASKLFSEKPFNSLTGKFFFSILISGEVFAKLLKAIENRHSGQAQRDPESRFSSDSGFRLSPE
jgi:hypothetical protein